MSRRILAGLLLVVGCAGAAGPGTRLAQTATLGSSGFVQFDLPAAAGTMANPPLYACYQLATTVTPNGWLPLVPGSAASGTLYQCLLAQSPTTGNLRVQIVGLAGTQVMAVVVY